jgi:GTP-binding protein
MAHLPEVVLVGKPNTGKSTLFNRLLRKRKAIEHSIAGVTRDYIQAIVHTENGDFVLTDTGGLFAGDRFESMVLDVAKQVLDRADLILFLVDAKTGMASADQWVLELIRPYQSRCLVVVNKVDTPDKESELTSFYKLGMGEPLPVSAAHGRGIGELLEQIGERLKLESKEPPTSPADGVTPSALAERGRRSGRRGARDEEAKPQSSTGVSPVSSDECTGKMPVLLENATGKRTPSVIKVTIVGRPNVGKSTLINALLGKERAIVSPHAGTTRDVLDIAHTLNGQAYVFMDTAGLRRPSKVHEDLEYYSVSRALDSLKDADVVLLVLDAMETISEQDQRIAARIEEAGCGVVILLNKWDLIPKNEHTILAFEDEIQKRLGGLRHAAMLTISAKTKQRVSDIYARITEVYQRLQAKIPTPDLNRCLQDVVREKAPPSYKGRRLKIFYAVHVSQRPFLLHIFVNDPGLLHFSYRRYLENRLREQFPLEGVIVKIAYRKK